MAVTVTLTIPPFAPAEPPVEMDMHHIFSSGEMLDTPTKTLHLRVGLENSIVMHSRMALVVQRGTRDRLPLDITHGDKGMTRGLSLVEICLGDQGEPGIELSRRRVPPGERVMVALERADVLVIREIEEPST
ncbi:hypothetical protein [Zoogloea sp.]|uniref:hypothetical protein n=1 Tax=Zoogloea sp. TaxID=49181 RepID=UPI0025DD822F|nr:hypothetical protein [Zoogloea sp.]MCK6396054.1 hypothetical protein [Zoogloea sp.]